MSESDPPPAPPEQPVSVRQVFARYGDPNYVLIPHRKPAARWLFFNSWLLALFLLLILLCITVGTILSLENRQDVGAALAVIGPAFASQDFLLRPTDDSGIDYVVERDIPEDFTGSWSDHVLKLFPEARFQAGTSTVTVTSGDEVEIYRTPRHFLFLTGRGFEAFLICYFTLLLAIPALLTVVLVGWLVKYISHQFPRNLYALARSGRLLPGPDGESRRRIGPLNWRTYGQDLERTLLNPVRWVFFVFWLVVFGSLMFSIVEGVSAMELSWPMVRVYTLIGAVGSSFLLAYFLGVLVWQLVVIVLYFQRLPAVFALDIQPTHGDGCGGLARLGQLSLFFGVTFTVPTIVLILFFAAGFLALISSLLTLALIVAIVLLPVGSIAFFWPLWRIHREMSAARDRYQDEAVSRIAPVEKRLRRQLASGKLNDPETEQLERLLDRLQMLYPAQETYPTWPVSGAQFVGFFTTQIAPLAAALLTLVEIGDSLRPG